MTLKHCAYKCAWLKEVNHYQIINKIVLNCIEA